MIINEWFNRVIEYYSMMNDTFLGTVIVVGFPIIIIFMLWLGFTRSGKQIPEDTCYACGQKLPKEKHEE
jgi:esterase/lipase